MPKRKRRIIVNLDTGWGLPGVEDSDASDLIDAAISFLAGQPGSQVDSIWWCWGEMNYAPYRSRLLPVNAEYQQWLKHGVDPLRICREKCRGKGLEAFYTFRINSGNDWQDWALPHILKENPGWGIPSPVFPAPHFHFNYAVKEAREYKLSIVREVIENYDFDGFEIDWRCALVNLPLMESWPHRDCLTEFMRSVRTMVREIGERKGRTILLAARVPENIEGCHHDGIDVETWVQEKLVDILALGCHNFEVDIEAFRRITVGSGIKLYASIDEHHPANGYEHPPIEIFRGVSANFWHQGIDGIYAFNFYPVPVTRPFPKKWEIHRKALCEMGSPGSLELKDKVFVTSRRGGGGWPSTAEYFYVNSNAYAQLPKRLSNHEKEESYITITVGDDVNTLKDHIESIVLRVLLSDTAAEKVPVERRIHETPVRIGFDDIRSFTVPPEKGIEDIIRVRLNGVVLGMPAVREGWLCYPVRPALLARGRNVVAFTLKGREPQLAAEMTVEKLEISVIYR